jgi:exodeoxyribonuclease V alpha subunit
MKTNNPDISWLCERWGLPDGAVPHVLRLLETEAHGGTACPVTDPPDDWGPAAQPAAGTATSPLVLVETDGLTHLQSRRLFAAEHLIARRLRMLAAREAAPADERLLDALFPANVSGNPQRTAAVMAVQRHLAVITGGPGSGKTFTMARVLALLLAAGLDRSRIKLAAPTGKAAERMRTSISAAADALPADFPATRTDLLAIAESSGTLHRLLGADPSGGSCRFHSGHPLPCSVLVVDECSMIDVFAWRALLDALPADARLILLGDPCQLESVGMGCIFREIADPCPGAPLSGCVVELTTAHRFKGRPAISLLASAIRRGDGGGAATLLEEAHGDEGLSFLASDGHPLAPDRIPPAILAHLQSIATADDPGEALGLLGRACILTAHRRFADGADALGARIEEHFTVLGTARNHPLIINRNDPVSGLRNGTVGIIREDAGARRAWFSGPDGQPRAWSVAALPEHSPAWAITIHRSQGSEYDDVLVVLPRGDSPLATRELLYTAITRARRNLYIHGHIDAVRQAVAAESRRSSLLSVALRTRAPGE